MAHTHTYKSRTQEGPNNVLGCMLSIAAATAGRHISSAAAATAAAARKARVLLRAWRQPRGGQPPLRIGPPARARSAAPAAGMAGTVGGLRTGGL